MNLNKVQLAGNLTRDPECRYASSGTAICKIGVAVNREWKDKSGERKKDTVFVDVDFFGPTAENVAKYFKKGRPIYLEGRLKLDQWEDKQTREKRSRLGIVADTFQFIGGKGDGSNESADKPAGESANGSVDSRVSGETTKAEAAPATTPEDDVPF